MTRNVHRKPAVKAVSVPEAADAKGNNTERRRSRKKAGLARFLLMWQPDFFLIILPCMNDKMNRLEEALAHQEKQIQDLSDMVSQQWAEIDGLKRSILKLQGKLSQVESVVGEEELSVSEQALRDKPPHY